MRLPHHSIPNYREYFFGSDRTGDSEIPDGSNWHCELNNNLEKALYRVASNRSCASFRTGTTYGLG